MRQNSIDYPGERAAQRADIAKQAGYTGDKHWSVTYHDQQLIVCAADEIAAIHTAAKRWNCDWRRTEYHQNAKAYKLPYVPGRPGEVL